MVIYPIQSVKNHIKTYPSDWKKVGISLPIKFKIPWDVGVFAYTFWWIFDGKLVGKYTSPMDPMAVDFFSK